MMRRGFRLVGLSTHLAPEIPLTARSQQQQRHIPTAITACSAVCLQSRAVASSSSSSSSFMDVVSGGMPSGHIDGATAGPGNGWASSRGGGGGGRGRGGGRGLQGSSSVSSAFPAPPHHAVSLGPSGAHYGRSGHEAEGEEDFFGDEDDAPSSSSSPPPKSAAAVPPAPIAGLAKVMPVINPFNHRVMPRHSPVIQQLLSVGFTLNHNNILVPAEGFCLHEAARLIKKKVKNVRAKAALLELAEHPEGTQLLRERCQQAKEVVAGTFLPPKLTTSPDPMLEEIAMTVDQCNFIALAKEGQSLYIGGSAGTGKTVLLKAIHRQLSAMGLKVAMTATTGVSSVHLGGTTFHSAFGVPIGDNGKWDTAALRVVDTIIVDEVSLLGKRLLEEFNRAAQIARLSDAPFGGIQMILCGDFLQLSHEDGSGAHDPCYASPLFRHLVALQLVTPLRHKEGDPLLDLLRKLRVGEYDEALASLSNDPPPDSNPVYIFPKRRSVVTVNAMKLSALTTEQLIFTPQCGPTQLTGSFTQSLLCRIPTRFDKGAMARAIIDLLRAQIPSTRATEPDVVVMPTRGAEDQYCLRLRHSRSGTLYDSAPSTPRLVWDKTVRDVVAGYGGVVEDVYHDGEPDSLLPYSVSLSANMAFSSESILQLKVGCRVMVNRNLSRTISNGALGTIEGFAPLNYSLVPQRKEASVSTANSRSGFERLKTFSRLPVVRMESGELIQIPPVSEPVGGSPATYYYGHSLYTLPIQLGYAFTVHKVQGLTIDGPVVVNCDDYFHCPHLIYVACSRVRQMHQLTVKGVSAHQVVVSPSSLAFAQSLAPATEEPILTADNVKGDWYHRLVERSGGVLPSGLGGEDLTSAALSGMSAGEDDYDDVD